MLRRGCHTCKPSFLHAGKSPGRQQAQALSGVQVVFAAAPAAARSPSPSQPGSQSPSRPSTTCKGLRSRPAGSKAAAGTATHSNASAVQPGSGRGAGAGAGGGGQSQVGSGGRGSTSATQSGGGAGNVHVSDIMTAVQIAEALSRGHRPGAPPVAIGNLELVPPRGERVLSRTHTIS